MHSPDDNQSTLTVQLADEAATAALGRQLAPLLQPGMIVWLDGDLGAGKTTLVRSLLRARNHSGPVRSPTYTLIEIYVISRIYWYHFDFYRFNFPEEFLDAGLGEYFRDDAVCLVEWPEKAAGYLPAADLVIRFHFAGNGRTLDVVACSEEGQECLRALKRNWQPHAAD
ncbi:MAG TPA: tRNA (adenosine(37)-N6)-threonylcarbamoyltransferase complex ATPase subunit type 1 TsaE [Accumulibacter sp.]|uniref:tRNA (adenosine(37)-N6)-threonylcarbamoyltransferase complex ATPase subunit type 1 TsaE n=1 Tax=Accumulibacter sp. TaxID=2053492 RepID=UPI0025CCF094|nr:tRNA (adenosine(37)-N6)-threonylcarbamoyltransferase complex ATPase subunit type 1 TsaE [Accumulibacter sp.]MCM8600598.1 tRNA (adenosine(37)-N6)-threonylcarbamoyltransferase complex ATPase subunit type 1 TsaE [Accumulibacter sp.]MCM8664749.1 tRNA (adenosine(37)-N6)-threonylcarbamoyltransferase complex ATPase subunit type 1 TsaE [Accumulibacter sp.]HNC52214.1 tRNA (adenosine(37)-N6)-threonylcarbamoyltransferase complex ATPase subunit type 1 TsaE [Accumulibacter sp.]